jgi:hypothetical protein
LAEKIWREKRQIELDQKLIEKWACKSKRKAKAETERRAFNGQRPTPNAQAAQYYALYSIPYILYYIGAAGGCGSDGKNRSKKTSIFGAFSPPGAENHGGGPIFEDKKRPEFSNSHVA